MWLVEICYAIAKCGILSNYFLANGLGIETKEYNLIPEQEWQVDLDHMESIIGEPFKNRTSSHLRSTLPS